MKYLVVIDTDCESEDEVRNRIKAALETADVYVFGADEIEVIETEVAV